MIHTQKVGKLFILNRLNGASKFTTFNKRLEEKAQIIAQPKCTLALLYLHITALTPSEKWNQDTLHNSHVKVHTKTNL